MPSTCPPGQVLALRFDNAIGKAVSGDLAVLLFCLANSCAQVAEDESFSQIQKYLTSFLFDEGRQVLRILISGQGKEVDIQHTVDQMVNVFPLTKRFGDLDVLYQFRPNLSSSSNNNSNTNGADSNELRLGVGLVGMPPLAIIANKMRNLISLASDNGEARNYSKQMAESLLDAMLQLFPNGHQFLTDLFIMETFNLNLRARDQGVLMEMEVDMNIEKLQKLYPAVANWLHHLQEGEFAILDMHTPGTQPEDNIDSAPCVFKGRLEYSGGFVSFKSSIMLSATPIGTLLYFDQKSGAIIKTSDGKPRVVELDENKCEEDIKFRIVLKDTIRLHELGCGTFSLPTIVLQMTIRSSNIKYPHLYEKELDQRGPTPAHRLELRILHVGDKRLTSIFVRPFFNLRAFREMLMKDFHLEFDFIPTTTEKHDFFEAGTALTAKYEAVAGHWSMVLRLKMNIVSASSMLVSFFRMFASTQLANPDDLRFWWQIASALHRDMKLMHGRLARAEGNKPDFELANDEQTMFRPKTQKTKNRSRMRCVIS